MFLIACIILLVFPREAAEGAREGFAVAYGVIASILPFAVFSGAIISSLGERAVRLISKPFAFLGIHPLGAFAMITGLLGGYPTGCRNVCTLYSEGRISKESAEKMLAYANNGGIVFALSVCPAMLGSTKNGAIIFFSNLLATMLVAALFGREADGKMSFSERKKLPPAAAVGKSLAAGGSAAVSIMSSFIAFYAMGNALGLERAPFLYGVWEFTKGIAYSGQISSVPLAAFFFSLGGVCTLAQGAALCSVHELSLKKLFLGRAVAAPVACIIAGCLTMEEPYSRAFSILTLIAIASAAELVKLCKKTEP